MKTFERSNLKDLREDMVAALQAVALKHGVQFTPKGCSFSTTAATFRIEAAVINDGGVAETKERQDFSRYASIYGLKPEWLDQSFRHGSDTYTIIGLATRKSKAPVLARNQAFRTYGFPTNVVAALMNAKTPVTA